MTDTTAQHIAARDDVALVARLIAVAEQAHIPNPKSFVQNNVGQIISTTIGPDSTITSVHAYASIIRAEAVAQLPPLPGLNPAAVTDAQLATAVQAVWVPPTV